MVTFPETCVRGHSSCLCLLVVFVSVYMLFLDLASYRCQAGSVRIPVK